jgi:Uma2 family endonuclease
MSAVPKLKLTPAAYLDFERGSEFRHEYLDGEIFRMSGGSRNHTAIVTNLTVEIGFILKKGPCIFRATDSRVLVSKTGLYTYPDILILCKEPEYEHGPKPDTLLNPDIIMEVLSPSTRDYDRTVKFRHYKTLDSLCEYLLIEQDTPIIDHFVRGPGGKWTMETLMGMESSLELATMPLQVAFEDIYRGVTFVNSNPMSVESILQSRDDPTR